MMLRPTNNILIINTNFWAYGELFIALELGESMKGSIFNPIFLVPPSHTKLVTMRNFECISLIPKNRNLNRALLKDIENTYKPICVITADFIQYHFSKPYYGLAVGDLDLLSGKKGTIDIYGFEQKRKFPIDTYGFAPREFIDLSIDYYDFRLQPIPVLKQVSDSIKSTSVFQYRLFDKTEKRTEAIKEKCRNKIGLTSKDKMILMTSGSWQKLPNGYDEHYNNIRVFIQSCITRLEEILLDLPVNTKIYCVGERVLYTEKEHPNFTQLDKMSLNKDSDFYTYANAADLFLSLNSISTSMIELVLKGIPTLILESSFFKHASNVKWVSCESQQRLQPTLLKNCTLAYPFRMFPVGWYNIIGRIMKNNGFYKLFAQNELFLDGCRHTIRNSLQTQQISNTKPIDDYLERIGQLRKIDKTFEALLQV